MINVRPFLMFEGRAAEAMNFYVALFPDAQVLKLKHFEGSETAVERGLFRLGNLEIMVFDSPAPHAFTFTPSVSLFVTMDSAADIDRCFAVLSEGGKVMMPLDAYPFSPQFAWVQDRFGVSWQLTLPMTES